MTNPLGAFLVFRQIFGRYRWHILVLVLLGFASAILEGIGINAAIPLVSFFTGGGAPTDPISTAIAHAFDFFSIPFSFRYLLVFILSLFILRAIATAVFGYIRGWVTADFLSNESEDMLRRTMLASWPFLLKQKIGNVQNTLVRDIQRSGNLLETVGQIIQSFSGFLMYLLIAANISLPMTLYTLAGGAVLLFFIRPFLGRTRQAGQLMATTEKKFAQFLSEHIIGMKAIKAAGVERLALASGNTFVRSLRTLSIRLAITRSASVSLFQPFSLLFVIALFVLTYKTPGFSIISFAASLYLIQKIFVYLESGQNALHSVSELLPYAQNIQAFKRMLGEHREQKIKGEKPFIFKHSLQFEGVSFSYSEESPILKDISFSIARGETVGFIGPSGAGKTSLADIILRLFKPHAGRIMLDGVPIEEIGVDEWRRRVGYVSQDVFLLNDTIEENIRFYRTELTEADIVEAAKQANIYDFIMTLPDAFKTNVGDRGVMLSGGQRQRIALARALAGKPDILVLDEATSALDSASEELIQEALAGLHGQITVFTIAHRLSTVADADTILVLEDGHITEQGSPRELLENPNSYFSTHGGHRQEHAH